MVNFIRLARNVILSLVVLAAVGLILFMKIDRYLNFQSVQATVLDFSKFCRPVSDKPDVQALFDASPEFAHGKLGPCDALAQFKIDENSFQMSGRSINLRVSKVWRTKVRYISPNDQKTHESIIDLGPKDGEGLTIGTTLAVLADKRHEGLLQEQ